ncbi:MAG: DUF3667 domain-containing protein [Bacteroidaceae bacterium]|nr:DUF3667 domain-containing protein [Bacteroidaceae bacterium]
MKAILISISKLRNAASYVINKHKRDILLRSFRIWQHRPHRVDPMSDESHKCASCGTTFVGNYCPRCGQSASIGRFSFTKTIQLFLNVWGVGNRSMFRSIRDLILRPGYMIRDYLSGMHSAYFPPFEMFFLLATVSLLVESGFMPDRNHKNEEKSGVEITVDDKAVKELLEEENIDPEGDIMISVKDRQKVLKGYKYYTSTIYEFCKANPTVSHLFMMILFSVPMFFFFRTTPNIERLRFSEFVVALVYISNSYSIFSITGHLLGSKILKLMAIMMIFITLKQLTGYSKRRVLGYLVLTTIISFICLLVLIAAVFFALYLSV